MEEIDSLIGVAQDKAVQAIGVIDRAAVHPADTAAIVLPIAQHANLGELRDQGMGLSVYCGNPRCGHLRPLDLDGLIETYGTHYDFITEKRLASKLVCKRCQNVGGRLVVVSDKRPRY
ncbi:hypothetical protein HB777_33700 [Mesorhizobium loti]|nr:hypothetical protein HB777_33700 [Mesorhizobium loti]